MRHGDIVVGEEYELTSQQVLHGGRLVRVDRGRAKVLAAHDKDFDCQYVAYPSAYRQGQLPGALVTVSGRSILRPWSEVERERADQQQLATESRAAQESMLDEAEQLADQLATLQLRVHRVMVEVDAKRHTLTGEGSVVLDLPLSALRGLAHVLQDLDVKPQPAASALPDLLV